MVKLIKKPRNLHTKRVLVNRIYHGQKAHSNNRGHPAPTYNFEELLEWIVAQPNFNELFSTWTLAGHPKKLIPSVDRLDDTKPYTFSNIRLVTWGVNHSKENKIESIPINQLTLAGELIQQHESISAAARAIGNLAANSNISSTCKGRFTKAYGFKWEYCDEVV